ncbi:CIC11C00000002933 [Sungouiella intermedia]|uniref:U1 small nuclear ribonucleoprotein component SNU71 n=1 Tax=Sungouiella intermedia TaxID=45354 RepID=A0A1L0BYG9_9ASCO|nr:CIC11C00000002933 [[Candida] intermedia]
MSFAIREVDDEYYARKKSKSKGKTPSTFKKPVDISKVNLPVIKVWLEDTIHEQLPEDDIAVEFIYELLKSEESLAIDTIREQMNDFLGERESLIFCESLWKLLLSAQKDKDGIPEQLLEQRKKQLERETANQAQQMIAELRLKPDYSRPRSNRWGQKDARDPRDRRSRNDERAKSPQRRQSPERNIYGSKTNYNRSQKDRGMYQRDSERSRGERNRGERNRGDRDRGNKYEKRHDKGKNHEEKILNAIDRDHRDNEKNK